MLPIKLASKYDLSFLAGPVLDQGAENSCVENGIASYIDILMREAGHAVAPLSRQQLYNDQRTAFGKFDSDYGSITDITLKIAQKTGIASEASFGYGPATLYEHPSAAVVSEAAQHTITSFTELNPYVNYTTLITEVKTALSQGKPVLLSFRVHDYFFNEQGPLSEQINYGFSGSNSAGHCVVITAADDTLNGGSYIVKNSWGTVWGFNGYGTVSYKQFAPNMGSVDLQSVFVINGFNHIDTTYTDSRCMAAYDYAIALHRAGEITGVDYFAGKIASTLSNAQALDGMIASSEGSLIYSAMNSTQFVESCYGSILGRHSDAGGLVAWTNLLNTGISRGTLMDDMFTTVLNMTGDVVSHDYLLNVGNVAEYMSIATQYAGGKDALTNHELSMVTSDANQVEILKVGIVHDFGIV